MSRIQGLDECVNFRFAGIAKQKSKDEQDQENPNDFRDPSVEEKERRLAMDQDEEEEGSVKDEDTDLKNTVSGAAISFRKLICVDETSKVFMLLCYITILQILQLSFIIMLITRTQITLFFWSAVIPIKPIRSLTRRLKRINLMPNISVRLD